nr:hypothetical protein CFP56_00421 [Quercus suber]
MCKADKQTFLLSTGPRSRLHPPDEVGCVVCRARRTVAVSSRGKLIRVAAAGARLGCADGYRVNGKVVYTTMTAMSAYRARHQIHCIEPEGFRRERHGPDLHVHPRQKLDDVRDCKRCQECKQSRETKSMDPKLKLTQESHDAEPDRSHSSNAPGKRLISVTKVPYSCSSRYGRTRITRIGYLDTECPANKAEATDSRGDGMISTDLPGACRWLCKWLQEPEGQWQFTEQGSKASINMIGRHEGVVRRCGNGMRKWLTDLAGNKYKITASEVLMVPYAGSCHEISGRPCQLQPQRSVLKLEVRVHRFCPRSLDLSKMPVVLQ